MERTVLILLTGIIAGVIDVAPMIKMKLDRYSIISAFVYYLILPFIIANTTLFGMDWWLKGGVIGLMLALPVIIMVMKDDRKSAVPMVIMSIVLGTGIAAALHILL